MARRTQKPANLSNQTVLFRWAMGQMGVGVGGDGEDLMRAFRDSYGLSATAPPVGESPFAERLPITAVAATGMTSDEAAGYEANIAAHTRRLNAGRHARGERVIRWLYFQYLALFLTERYLDRFFTDPAALRDELNAEIARHNAALPDDRKSELLAEIDPGGDAREQMARLAFWCATGSGKTLLLHANVMQFRHWHAKVGQRSGWPKLDRVLLVTPNAGLTLQHAKELEQNGFNVGLPGRGAEAGLFGGKPDVEVVEIHKLQPKAGPDTLAVEGFTGCNLVLVDEGHTGLSGKEETGWRAKRNLLASGGFVMEYSATFKEALDAVTNKGQQQEMRQEFATSLLMDYSYPGFYRDGYGKDFEVLNLDTAARQVDAAEEDQRRRYLSLALLRFARQQEAFDAAGDTLNAYAIDKPLWMFVGGTVVGASKKADTLDKEEVSDVIQVLAFLAWFASDAQGATAELADLLTNGFKTKSGRDLLADGLDPLPGQAAEAEALRERILAGVFNAPGGGSLHVRGIGGAAGELSLDVAGHDPFGVIFVGDASGLAEACRKAGVKGLTVDEPDPAGGSLFKTLDDADSRVSLLLGAKKFAEGWNSYRVSSLGLMHVGKSQGAQIVQLFGRGVRLRGKGGSMRRSDDARTRPKYLSVLERLQVAGVRAGAMKAFEDWVRQNTPEVLDRATYTIDVIQTRPERKLRTLGLPDKINGHKLGKNSRAFAELGPMVRLAPPGPEDDWLLNNRVALDLMPKVAAVTGTGGTMVRDAGVDAGVVGPDTGPLNARVLGMLDYPALVAAIEAHKAARGLERLHVDVAGVRQTLASADWYTLAMPAKQRALGGYAAVQRAQDVAERLLKGYAEKLCAYRRQRWEAPYLEVREVTGADTREGEQWEIEAPADHAEQVEVWVEQIKKALDKDPATAWQSGLWGTAPFAGHLYQPLLMIRKGAVIKTRPVALDTNEAKFVQDLRGWCEAHPEAEVHLLRNDAATGLGFFEAGNFHPDFLLWRVDGGRERLAFVDPKGLRNHRPEDDKVTFATKLIPRVQERLAKKGSDLELSAFLISNTPFGQLRWVDGQERLTKDKLKAMHVLFDEDDDVVESVMQAMG